MNRLLPVTALATAAAAGFGQNPENDVTTALTNLSPFTGSSVATNNFAIVMLGTETVGNATSTFETDFFFQTGTNPRSNLPGLVDAELDHYDTTGSTIQKPVRNLTKRFVGDGQTFWAYDYLTGHYSAYSYSYPGSTPPTGYVVGSDASKLFSRLYTASTGSDTYIALLMRELFPGPEFFPSPQYSSWASDYIPEIPDALAGTPDPLDPSAAPYGAASAGSEVVLYGASGQIGPGGQPRYPTPTRSVAFELNDPSQSSNWQLAEIHFEYERPNDVLEFNLTVNPADFPPPRNVFMPLLGSQLAGWQPVAAPMQGNG